MTELLPLLAALTLLLAACGTVPTAPLPPTCPKGVTLPPLDRVPASELALDFTDRMESFLSGKLPAPIDYELRSPPATGTTKRPARN